MIRLLLPLTLILVPTLGLAQAHSHAHGHAHGAAAPGPYAGFQGREIAALSPEDIAELARGGGWGLALPAEVNGWPGPAHLIELQSDLALDPDQIAAITAIRDAMRAEAIAAGAALIAAEGALDRAFRDGNIDEERLAALIDAAEAARSALRGVHFAAHLRTRPILGDDQIAAYARLSGY